MNLCKILKQKRDAERGVNRDKDVGLMAKGDILVFDGTTLRRLPVGTDGQVLTADSTAPLGVKWVQDIEKESDLL